jgi:hypothetical protein
MRFDPDAPNISIEALALIPELRALCPAPLRLNLRRKYYIVVHWLLGKTHHRVFVFLCGSGMVLACNKDKV